MKTLLKTIGVLLGLTIVAVVTFMLSPGAQRWLGDQFRPNHDFDPSHAEPALDYAEDGSWVAHPRKQDNADLVPAGELATSESSVSAYVFFIHPTAYLGNAHWMSSLAKDTATEDNRQWMITNQVSAFNGCCSIYAPYYREASIHAFLEPSLSNGAKVLGFAYSDVVRAFAHFIKTIPEGSPFIVASHSQGTVHGQRLLQQVIDGTPLVERLVAAYLIGCTIPADIFNRYYTQIKACNEPDDLHCVIAFDTWREGGGPIGSGCPNWHGDHYQRSNFQWLCVNPLSWVRDELKVDKSQNPGSVPILNEYNIYLFGEDKAAGLVWSDLQAPIAGVASAQCTDGVLRTNDQTNGAFDKLAINAYYHGLDYALFYISIRENARLRTRTWWLQQAD
jgi:hypothetical protein